ncbi:hypothetical protein ATE67_16305 [Sphingopyxis sp. H050]|uniref:hypothetical protein n=1 Tax=Sphingopyxis sp. H050 TaxID=1759072 RepID=UPI0007371A9F|nr:hypothetical protein [Sphingopyxis sp. H050]KTE19090.1 hypothetical protein ATE67_16305 [Sphingopyxis sp. H050]
MLILFGAGVEAPECANACSDPVSTGRWIVGLSLIIFILPLVASPKGRAFFRRPLTSSATLKPWARLRSSMLSRLMG